MQLHIIVSPVSVADVEQLLQQLVERGHQLVAGEYPRVVRPAGREPEREGGTVAAI